MTNDLVAWVADQIVESALDDETGLVILAALDGDDELDDYLDHGRAKELEPFTSADEADAAGTFLASIAVEGFRGIGPRTELELRPRPGLTIVAGRDGSGKSSLSEALEFALTGDTYRWKSKSSVEWKQAWRNLHHPHAAISVGFVEERNRPLTVTTTWADGATDVATGVTKSQRRGLKQQDGTAGLGWKKPLEQYRPILSYDELGGLLESGRSALYDALASILGVEQLSDALKRVQVRLKTRKAPEAAATARRKQLAGQAATLVDERATQASALLRSTSPDLPALRALATGSAVPDTGPLQPLRALASLTAPFSADEAAEMQGILRHALDELDKVNADTSARTLARLELLESALAVHTDQGDMNCPVCRQGQLDAAWHADNALLAAQQRKDLNKLDVARLNVKLATSKVRHMITPRPASLGVVPEQAVSEAVAAAVAAWDSLFDVASDAASPPREVADRLETGGPALLAALAAVRDAASKRLAELEDVWQPFAGELAAWCAQWEGCLTDRPAVKALAAADTWLKGADLRRKNELLAPIEQQAKDAWAKLRQESNIEIGSLSLAGTRTQRRVVIEASVDGIEQQGIPVLSQGELHALALSLFIPRATMSGSPFRFLVLDDPIQAMDPAKVDGLVELLGDLAKTHQVIVLSHDDRLPAAVRRSPIKATVLEVTRGAGSKVSIDTATDPARRYLDDAFGLVAEYEREQLPETAIRRTLPGLLRFAVEAIAKDGYFTARLTAGMPLGEVEDAWEDASTTRQKVTLAVFGEARDNHELDTWASASHRKAGLRNVGTAMHNGLRPDIAPMQAVRDVEKLVDNLRALG